MTAFLSPIAGGGFQAFDNQGQVLAGGLLYTYFAGSTSQQATWTNSTQTVTNANPIVLDSAGRSTNELWLQGGQAYKFVLKDSLGNTLATWDNVPGINDASYAAFSEWVAYGSAPTYVDSNTFTVSGNATALLQVGRRIQFFILTGTFYATISASAFNSGPGTTTVDLTLDSTGLDNTLYAFAYSFLSSTNSSIPIGVFAPLASPAFTGHPTAPTQTPLSNDTQVATDAYVDLAVAVEKARALAAEALLAPIASPTFTGDPKAPTASPGDSDTSIANTGFVAAAVLVETTRALAAETLLAPKASPALTGVPTAPTAANGTNTTQLATTAFVLNTAIAGTQSVPYSARTANTILAAGDRGSEIDYTSGTFSQTLTAAATLGANWYVWARNSGSGVVTWDPNGAETIGGAATADMNRGDVWLVVCDGTNFQLTRMQGLNQVTYASGSGNFTFPPGCTVAVVEAWGAGGGAGAGTSAFGGGGGYCKKLYRGAANSTVAYSVGAGSSGANGGDTTFGTMTASGGTATNGTPGAASGGDVNISGGYGFNASTSCVGGSSPNGAGAAIAINPLQSAGAVPGGGAAALNGSAVAGGAGLIRVQWS